MQRGPGAHTTDFADVSALLLIFRVGIPRSGETREMLALLTGLATTEPDWLGG